MCIKRVERFFSIYGIRSSRILVALSGGSDSVALFHLLYKHRATLDIQTLAIAHVNHGLRGVESKQDEEFVKVLAKENKCRLFVKSLSGKSLDSPGLELWARNQRYCYFDSIRQRFDFDYVATGHTLEDQAETLLMHVSRGCGLSGLCGVAPVRHDGVIRPLLDSSKKELQQWLQNNHCDWQEDSSNRSLRYTRNRIRHTVIPALEKKNPNITNQLAMLARYFQGQKKFFEPLVNHWISKNMTVFSEKHFSLNKKGFKNQEGIFHAGLIAAFETHHIPIDKEHICAVIANSHKHSGRFLLKSGWSYYPGLDVIEFAKDQDAGHSQHNIAEEKVLLPGTTLCRGGAAQFEASLVEKTDESFPFDHTNNQVYLDLDDSPEYLVYRRLHKEDLFCPQGFHKEILLHHYLKKRGISAYFRKNCGVIVDSKDRVLWVPGVAMSEQCKVTEKTEICVKISFVRLGKS